MDYTGGGNTVDFLQSDEAQTVCTSFIILDNLIEDGNKMFGVSLETSLGDGATDSASVTIIDNDRKKGRTELMGSILLFVSLFVCLCVYVGLCFDRKLFFFCFFLLLREDWVTLSSTLIAHRITF